MYLNNIYNSLRLNIYNFICKVEKYRITCYFINRKLSFKNIYSRDQLTNHCLINDPINTTLIPTSKGSF